MKKSKLCPECRSDRVVPIAYGEPTDETLRAAHRGEVSLGGCVISGEDPDRECLACGHRWIAAKRRD